MPRFLGSLLIIVTALPAVAQQPGDATAGRELAAKLCSSCHIVGNQRSGSDQAPPFPAIAKDPEVSLTQLHGWGGTGHPMLPKLALSQEQVADINAYLDSLRGLPPAEGAASPDKRVLPSAPAERIGPPIGKPTERPAE
ncbi:MAG: c-type cytochrome [Geminicoccaceae bacterium]